ncbi:hypothetical protein KR044_002491, partial [Drosophila immigrans]
EAVEFKFSNVVCKNLDQTRNIINVCRLKAVSRNVTKLFYNATLLISANEVKTKIETFKKANGFKPWILKADIDVCRFLRKSYNPFAMLMFKSFKDFSNFNHSCPYTGHIIVDGFYLKYDLLPHAFPTGEYLVNATWIVNKKPIALTSFYFIFTEDLI